MNLLKSVFNFELKRRMKLRDILIFFVILLIFLYIADDGKNKYFDLHENKETFQKIELTRVKQFRNYMLYGYYGISLLFIPSPFNTFGIDAKNGKLLSNVNSGERLDIFNSRKGKNYFDEKSGFFNLKGLTLLFSIFFSLLYGIDFVKNKPSLRFFSKLATPGKIFWASAVSRILILILAYLILLGFSLLWMLLYGINLFQPQILTIITTTILIIIAFFLIGCMIGSLKDKSTQWIIFGISYFLSIILIPGLADKYIQDASEDIESLFSYELKNLEIIMSVEKRFYEKFGGANDGENIPPEAILRLKETLDNEFKIIFAREEKMMAQIMEKIKVRHTVSCFFPVLFYNSVNAEASSCGDLSFIDFYLYSNKIKKEFIDFYVKKKYLEEKQPGQVESFVKKNENLFYAQSHLPYRFWLGIIFHLIVYIGGGGFFAYYCFKRSLTPTPAKKSTEKVNTKLKSGEDYHIDTFDYAAEDHVYNTASGKIKGFKGQITIDGKSIVTGEKQDVVYICTPADIPAEVKVNGLLDLFKGLLKLSKQQVLDLKTGIFKDILDKRFSELLPDLQLRLLFKIGCLKGGKIYMLHNLINKCSNRYIKEFAEEIKALKDADAIILYFNDNPLYSTLKVDHHIAYTRVDGYYEWEKVVE
jgi:hypothetical protein